MTVAVNLEGGASEVYSPKLAKVRLVEDPPTVERRIHGRVVDAAGHGVAGAAVIVGPNVSTQFDDHLFAEQGGTTRADGSFDFVVRRDEPELAMALDATAGWSAPVAVPTGRADQDLVISLPPPSTLAVHVRQGGAPRDARVTVQRPGLTLALDTDARGELEIAMLPPGRYTVHAHGAQQFAGGMATPTTQEVTLAAGNTTDANIDLPTGALVVATVKTATMPDAFVYYLVPGAEPNLDAATLDARRKTDSSIGSAVLGGRDANRPMQFHDIQPGDYTICVVGKSRTSVTPIACRVAEVKADTNVLELELSLGG
jgi:hypothetical protein